MWGEEEGSEQWTQVDNLQAQPSLARVYKFGTNRSGSCYLEFPAEVASIIGTGLRIYYAVSAGAAGNVNANTLTKFYGTPPITSEGFVDSEFTYAEDDFRILNPSGTTGGSDPQTIDDAYQEYLRIMGTFNTLVSERVFYCLMGIRWFLPPAQVLLRRLPQPLPPPPFPARARRRKRAELLGLSYLPGC